MTRILGKLGACALGFLTVASCEGQVSFEGDTSGELGVSADGSLLELLAKSVDAPWTTAYSGTRLVELRYVDDDGQDVTLAYRESVAADGTGRFALETTEILSFLADPVLFETLQETREGYLYRYRDFAIRDLDALFQSYVVVDLDQDAQVAGRDAREIELQPMGQGSTYHVFLDVETGLPLKSIEYDALGVQVALVEFESYDASPDLSGVAWYQGPTDEVELDPHGDLTAQAGFEVLTPTLLPPGYAPWKAAKLTDPDGLTWAKLTYTDGVQPLFLLHRDGDGPAVDAPGAAAVGTTTAVTDRVWVYAMGPVRVVEGILRGRRVLALGKVDEELLLDLLDSALD